MESVKRWSVLERVLAVVALLVFVGVGVLAVIAMRSGSDETAPDGCEVARDDSGTESNLSPVDVLRQFVQDRSDRFPLDDSWVLESDEDDRYRFVSDSDGYYEVDVSDGAVTRFMVCPDGLPDGR